MTIRESRAALVSAAAGVDAVAQELGTARTDVSRGDGRGSEFGLLAAGIPANHDTFIDQMIAALGEGRTVMNDLAQALRDTASDFGATDTSVADEFHDPDGTPR